MIEHIARIANTTRAHDFGYGFLLTWVFEHFGVELQKKVDAQVIDEVGSSTLMGCGFELLQEEDPSDEQGLQTPAPPILSSSSSQPSVVVLQQEQQRLEAELTAVKGVLVDEKELSTKRHEDLLAILATLTAKLSLLPPRSPLSHCFYPSCILFPPCLCYPVCTLRTLIFCLFVYILLTLVILVAEWFVLLPYIAYLLFSVLLCLIWMANLITVPYT